MADGIMDAFADLKDNDPKRYKAIMTEYHDLVSAADAAGWMEVCYSDHDGRAAALAKALGVKGA